MKSTRRYYEPRKPVTLAATAGDEADDAKLEKGSEGKTGPKHGPNATRYRKGDKSGKGAQDLDDVAAAGLTLQAPLINKATDKGGSGGNRMRPWDSPAVFQLRPPVASAQTKNRPSPAAAPYEDNAAVHHATLTASLAAEREALRLHRDLTTEMKQLRGEVGNAVRALEAAAALINSRN